MSRKTELVFKKTKLSQAGRVFLFYLLPVISRLFFLDLDLISQPGSQGTLCR
jgi:hypothetical protein